MYELENPDNKITTFMLYIIDVFISMNLGWDESTTNL